jgi:hypothetical protein
MKLFLLFGFVFVASLARAQAQDTILDGKRIMNTIGRHFKIVCALTYIVFGLLFEFQSMIYYKNYLLVGVL